MPEEEILSPRKARNRGRQYGEIHGYYVRGGWIYHQHNDSSGPVCNGWIEFYYLNRYTIEGWRWGQERLKTGKLQLLGQRPAKK